jgi:stage V sporulation protein D (sporulation-specific penicillin-binding protein)
MITPKRGTIYDKNGIVFAEDILVYNVIYDPGVLNQYDEEIRENTNKFISDTLEDITEEELNDLLIDKPKSHYEVLAKELEYEKVKDIEESIENNGIKGIFLEEHYKRYYPNGSMACDVIGFVNYSKNGTYGLEEYYNDYLNGEYGRMFGVIDDKKDVNQIEVPSEDGNNLILTIDYTIQKITETAISNFTSEHQAKEASAIVMNPNNGAVLAMASSSVFDLNNPYDLSLLYDEETIVNMTEEEQNNKRFEMWKNNVISSTYEPGSTFKPFVMAAALEEDAISVDDKYYCKGYKVLYGNTISCWKTSGHGEETVLDGLANSCNVVFMEVGAALGKENFYHYQKKFGFNDKTNIDLAGEVGGILYDYDKMGPVELATGSFGQGFNITQIQLITAFSSLVNGGNLYKPYVVQEIVDADDQIVKESEPELVRKVISESTLEIVTEGLEKVVAEGTGNKAQIEGYRIGGKTGTAEKFPREDNQYVVSFIGATPINDAQLVILVVIDEPDAEEAESSLAVNVFKEIMEKTTTYCKIFPDNED